MKSEILPEHRPPLLLQELPDDKFLACFKALWPDVELEEWQKEPLARIVKSLVCGNTKQRTFISITGANGTGKTLLMVWSIILSIVILEEHGIPFKGTLLSGKMHQLKSVLLCDVMKWIDCSTKKGAFDVSWTRIRLRGSLNSITPQAWDEKDPHKLAGQHGKFSLIFIDEGSTVPKPAVIKMRGCTTDGNVVWLITSNPDKNTGFVYDLHASEDSYPWITYSVSHQQLTFLRNLEFEKEVLAACGGDANHDDYRIQVLGLFPKMQSDKFMSRTYIEDARGRAPFIGQNHCYFMGCDFASGRANGWSTIVIRQGNTIAWAWRGKVDLAVFEMKIRDTCSRFNIPFFSMDEDGIGEGSYQRLQVYYPGIIGVHGGIPSTEPLRYKNIRAQLYDRMREWFMFTGHLPDDPMYDQLIKELLTLESWREGSQLIIQPKKVSKHPSPDFVDALAYTFAVGEYDVVTHTCTNEGAGQQMDVMR